MLLEPSDSCWTVHRFTVQFITGDAKWVAVNRPVAHPRSLKLQGPAVPVRGRRRRASQLVGHDSTGKCLRLKEFRGGPQNLGWRKKVSGGMLRPGIGDVAPAPRFDRSRHQLNSKETEPRSHEDTKRLSYFQRHFAKRVFPIFLILNSIATIAHIRQIVVNCFVPLCLGGSNSLILSLFYRSGRVGAGFAVS